MASDLPYESSGNHAPPTHRIAAQFGKALRMVRGALADAGLEVVGELDVIQGTETGVKDRVVRGRGVKGRCRVLLVDCPLISLQALALDRAAGVYLPLHLLLRAAEGSTHARIVNLAEVFDARLPAGAAQPIAQLTHRVTAVLDGLAKVRVQTS